MDAQPFEARRGPINLLLPSSIRVRSTFEDAGCLLWKLPSRTIEMLGQCSYRGGTLRATVIHPKLDHRSLEVEGSVFVKREIAVQHADERVARQVFQACIDIETVHPRFPRPGWCEAPRSVAFGDDRITFDQPTIWTGHREPVLEESPIERSVELDMEPIG